MTRVNEQEFLVTWIEAEGLVRGQATKTKADAQRLYDHLCTTPAPYIEVRKIGPIVTGADGKKMVRETIDGGQDVGWWL